MSETTNLDNSQSFDAQQATEEIATGDRKTPHINVSDDYEASKQFSVSDVDRSGEGEKAAEAATAPQFELHAPEATVTKAEPTGDPSDFRDMAKEVSHRPEATPVTDELVEKALEMGKPAE